MATDKDVLLAIRASVENIQSITQVATAIGQITARLSEQVAAAAKGEGSIEDLKRSYESLKTAGADIAKTQVKINVFQNQGADLDAARARLATITAEVQRLQAALIGVEAPTKAQARALTEATARQTGAATAAQNALKKYEETGAALEKLGVDTKNLGAAVEQTNALWTRTTSVMALAKGATDGYSVSLQAFKTASAAAAAATAVETKALQDKAAAATSLAAFRQQGTAALSAQAGLLTTAVPSVDLSGQSQVAASLERISAPAQAARRTLQGLEQQIKELATASLAAGKTTQDYADILRGLGAAQTALGSAGAAVDQFQNQARAVQTAKTALDAAHKSVFDLGVAVRGAAVEDQALVASLRAAQAQLTSSNAAYQRQVELLQRYDVALKAAGIDTTNLVGAQQRLLASANTLAPAIARLSKLVREGDTPGGSGLILGLRPYQLQNLGFQVNDLFTQVASGTSVMQAFSQQIGQIVQIPGVLTGILRYLPVVAAGFATVGVAVAAVMRSFRDQEALRSFQGILLSTTNSFNAQAVNLTAAQRTIKIYGASFKEAGEAVRQFIESGLNPSKIVAFGRASQDLADVYGVKLPEAAKTVASAFTGSIDRITELNKTYDFLTLAQAEHIRQLFEEGRAEEARAAAFEIFAAKLRAGAEEANGPWTTAVRNFSNAWDDLLTKLGQTPAVTGVVNALTGVILGLAKAFSVLSTASAGFLSLLGGAQKTGMAKITSGFGSPADAIGGVTDWIRGRTRQTDDGSAAAGLEGQIAAQKAAKDRLGGTSLDQAEANRIDLRIAQLEKELAVRKGLTAQAGVAAETAAAAAEVGARGFDNADKLGKTLADTWNDAAAAATTATNRQEIADAGLKKAGDEADLRAKKARALTQDDITELRRLAGVKAANAAADAGASAAGIEAERTRASLAEKRRIDEARAVGGGAAAKAAVAAEESVVSMMAAFEAKITGNQKMELDQRLLQFDEWLRKVRVRIEAARKAGVTDIGGLSLPEADAKAVALTERAKGMESMKASEQQLNELIRARNDLVATNNALAEAGAITQTQANEKNAQAFAESNAAITAGAAAWLEYAKAAGISGTALAAIAAKVELIGVQAKFVDPAIKELNRSIEQAFLSNAMTAFNDVAEALGGVIAGTKSWSDTFKALGLATAKFFAGLLKDIATAILKMEALKLLESLGLGGGGGGGIGGLLSGLFGGGGGAAASATAGFGNVPFFVGHGGQVVGDPSGVISRGPASWWANAPRYHEGMRGVGLSADEQRAVLQKGEEVLSKDDPRNALNGGKGTRTGGTEQAARFKQVLLVDPAMVPQAMVSAPGEQAFLTLISRHASTIRQLTGVR